MLSVDTWWVIDVNWSAVCCAARNTTFPSGWVICWLCTWPLALTLRCENWMLREHCPAQHPVLAAQELDVAQGNARARPIGDDQLDLFTVPRIEVGDPVAGELSRRSVQALARRL